MVVQGAWLVPILGTVSCQRALKGIGKGILDRGFCSEHVWPSCSDCVSGSPRWFAGGSTWGKYKGMCAGRPHLASTMGAQNAELGRSYFISGAVRAMKVLGDRRSLSVQPYQAGISTIRWDLDLEKRAIEPAGENPLDP